MFEDLQGKSASLFGHADEAQGNKCRRDNMLNAPERDWMEWQAGYACGAILMPVGALMDAVQGFRAENNLLYSNLSLQSEGGQKLIGVVTSAFQTSRDAARVRLLKKGVLTDTGSQHTKELF